MKEVALARDALEAAIATAAKVKKENLICACECVCVSVFKFENQLLKADQNLI